MNTSLHQLWQQTRLSEGRSTQRSSSAKEWQAQISLIEKCGKGIEQALHFLYSQQPSYEHFIQWLNFTGEPPPSVVPIIEKDVLSQDALAFWDKNGYLVIKNAVPPDQCAAARLAIWDFLDASPGDPASWYKLHAGKNGQLMLSFFDHPALEANRNSGIVRKAYEQLYGHPDIYRSTNKVSFNPPENDIFKFVNNDLHWDVSLQLPIPFKLQGLLYLTDVEADAGAFHCVPGFHKEIDRWINSFPADTDLRGKAKEVLEPVAITGNAGDFIIWHQALPHCATPNHGIAPRLVQYLTYLPTDVPDQEVWK